MARRRTAALFLAVAAASTLAMTTPAQASVSGKSYTVKTTIKGGKNLTVLLVSATGRTLASKTITKASQAVSLKTPNVSSAKGATLQLVSAGSSANKGEYFGPVVVGWSGSKAARSSKVYTKLKAVASRTISLGTMSIKKVGSTGKQGYAVVSKKAKVADTTTAAAVTAVKGRPKGVGSYGKTQSVGSTEYGVSASGVIATPVNPNPNPNPQPNNPQPGNQPQPGQPQPGGQPQVGAAPTSDNTLGGDKDDDGLPNAFDVDDDGDGKIDSADSDTPTPQVSADNGATDCGALTWRIFTNFKATGGNYQGTINAYGTGAYEATPSTIADTIGKTMSMVFQPITSVCGSNVTKTYIKGNGVPYAPAEFTEVGKTCNTSDYQWLIGEGRMCSTDGTGYDFGSKYTFSGTDLPSGQDTFTIKVETADGKSYEFTSSPGFVFVTHPMIVSYDDGAGEKAVQYGSPNVNISVAKSTKLKFKMYRPQRLAFDGETGTFYDLGGFRVSPDIPNGITNPVPGQPGQPGTQGPGKCDAQAVTDTSMASDTPIDTTNKPTMVIEWEIGKCFDAKNIAWSAGQVTVDIQVEPSGPGGNSAQKLFLTTTS